MIEKANQYFKKRSIEFIFSFFVVGVSLISFICLAIIFTQYANRVLVDQLIARDEQAMVALAQNIEDQIKENTEIFNTFYYQVIKDYDVADPGFINQMTFLRDCNSKIIQNVAVVDASKKIVYSSSPLADLDMIEKCGWYQESYDNITQVIYNSPNHQSFFVLDDYPDKTMVYARYVELNDSGKIVPGIMFCQVFYDSLDKLLELSYQNQGAYCFMMSQQDDLIYHPQIKLAASNVIDMDIQLENFKDNSSIKLNNHLYHINTYQLGMLPWKIYSLTSIGNVFYDQMETNMFIWALVVVWAGLIYLVERYIVKRVTLPLENLMATVSKFGDGELDVVADIEGVNEIKILANQFNAMVVSIKGFMKNIFRQEEVKWEMELNILQAQINPHFLYNSLDSIVWMIQTRNNDQASAMVMDLANFFRISLNKGDPIISLEKELAHAKSYLRIQSVRFDERFTYRFEVEEAVKQYCIPKIVLQPLIENALYHGLANDIDEGLLIVKGSLDGESVVIEIIDNGLGMDENTLKKLLKGKIGATKEGSGIGVKNVDARIKLCFGNDYGLVVFSEVDEGTTVRIIIPKVVNIDEYHKKKDYYLLDYFNDDSFRDDDD